MSNQDINKYIAENLKNMRTATGISLADAARMTGVSKSMIGQIERGESSPTVATLLKIADGLNIPFASLVQIGPEEIQVVKEADLRPILNDHGHFRMFPIVPMRYDRNYEMSDLIVDPSAQYSASALDNGTTQYIFVYEGELKICLGFSNATYTVSEGAFIHYPADQELIYRNDSERITRAVMITQYNKR